LAGIPKYWTECRKRYLADKDMLTRFLNRNAELMNRKTGYMERQETLDEEFGVTYAVLKPYIEEWQAEQEEKKAKRAAGRAKSEPEPVVPEAVSVTEVEAQESIEQIEGHGDLEPESSGRQAQPGPVPDRVESVGDCPERGSGPVEAVGHLSCDDHPAHGQGSGGGDGSHGRGRRSSEGSDGSTGGRS